MNANNTTHHNRRITNDKWRENYFQKLNYQHDKILQNRLKYTVWDYIEQDIQKLIKSDYLEYYSY